MTWILVGYVAFFTRLGWRRYEEACLTQSGNAAFLDCAFYNTLKGGIFWQHAANNSCFEAHPEPIPPEQLTPIRYPSDEPLLRRMR